MISWLLVIILAYLFFSLSNLGDKLVLSGQSKPITYTFYVGVINILAIFLLPFVDFDLPNLNVIFWIIAEAVIFILGVYTMFVALKKFEVSKVITTIGATQPIFIFILAWIFWGSQEMSSTNILAFSLLLAGSIIISFQKGASTTGHYLKITLTASLLFSLDYIIAKIIFLSVPFLTGLILTRIIISLLVLPFLLNKNLRKNIFHRQHILNKKAGATFLFAQTCGGVANFLQYFSISLAPIAVLPIINSLRGIQYVFLFLITLFFSFLFPKILKEEISKKIILQKIIAIVLIVSGLAILIS